jgi:hypothetical protein
MIVQMKDGKEINVFAIYWVEFNSQTVVLGLPRNSGGLTAINMDSVTVVEPRLEGRFVYYDHGIFHHSLIDENLLDDVLEYDEKAYVRFLSILKSEGLIDQDFY